MAQKRLAILFDLRRCTGCYACQVACKAEHDVPLGVFRIRVNTYEYGEYPNTKRVFIPTICAQAGVDSPMLKASKEGSLVLDDNGIVRRNEEKPSYNMDEAGRIVRSDPYGGVFIHPYRRTVDFCDFCVSTRDVGGGELPACAVTCNTGAIYFGDLNDPGSAISRYIKRWDGSTYKGEKVRVKRLKEKEVPEAKVLYIGLRPEMEEIIEGHKQFDPTFLEVHRWKEGGR